MSFLQPKMHVKDIHSIDLDKMWSDGFRGILLDLDNTFIPYGVYEPIPEDAENWLKKAQNKGFKVVYYSNATKWKVVLVCKQTNVFGVHKAFKPFSFKLKRCMDELGLPKEKVFTVGDQMFTDILGGNLAGIYTVLVEPIHDKDFWGTKVLRFMERCAGRQPLNN